MAWDGCHCDNEEFELRDMVFWCETCGKVMKARGEIDSQGVLHIILGDHDCTRFVKQVATYEEAWKLVHEARKILEKKQ